MQGKDHLRIRSAEEKDVGLILHMIRALAEYERMADQVTATEALLVEWLFEKRVAEVLIAESGEKAVGFALYFFNFSTFLGKAGIYLEDLYVFPEYRRRGIGKRLLQTLASKVLNGAASIGMKRVSVFTARLAQQRCRTGRFIASLAKRLPRWRAAFPSRTDDKTQDSTTDTTALKTNTESKK